jgi:hypothetical protein
MSIAREDRGLHNGEVNSMPNPLNTTMNKVTWPAMANAGLLLVNGRLP